MQSAVQRDAHLARTAALRRPRRIGATREERRGIDDRIEARRPRDPFLERKQCSALQQQPANATASERRPELGRQQERDHAAGARELHRPLGEDRCEVSLRGEAASGPGRLRTRLPRGLPKSHEPFAQCLAHRWRDVMWPHPRRIAHDDIESPSTRDLGKVRREREGERAAVAEPAQGRARGTERLAHGRERSPCRSGRRAPRLEEVRGARRKQQLAPLSGIECDPLRDRENSALPLGDVKRGRQRALARSARAHVAQPQRRKTGAIRDDGVREGVTRECVPFAHVPVEVRQRREAHRIVAVVLYDHREPESQLAEPDCGGVDVHAEDRPREHLASHHTGCATVAAGDAQCCDRLQRVHEERSGTAGRIEHADGVERVVRVGSHVRGERAAGDSCDQRMRRVERPLTATNLPGHERLEGATQHLGIDGRVGEIGRGLAGGEAVAR